MLKGDSVLLVRHQKDDSSYWLLPGGGVEPGESLGNALRRELLEETRLEVRLGDLVLASDSIAPDGSRHVVNLCFAAEVEGGELAVGDDERVVEARYVSSEELAGLTMHPDLRGELAAGMRDGFEGGASYLGESWVQDS